MSKYNELLRRVEMFEKLAIYGNRREFLHAIAQGQQVIPANTMSGHISPLPESVTSWGKEPKWQHIDPKAPFYLTPEDYAKYMDPAYLEANKPKPTSVSSYVSPEDAAKKYKSPQVGSQAPKSTIPALTSLKPNNNIKNLPANEDVRMAQNWLYQHGFEKEIGLSGGADGKLGPATIKALQEYFKGDKSVTDINSAVAKCKKYQEESSKETVSPEKSVTNVVDEYNNPENRQNRYNSQAEDVYPASKPPTSTWGVGQK